MKKLLICLLTFIMLVGCGQLPDDISEDEQLNMPDIVFVERAFSFDNEFMYISFTDCNGNYYVSSDKELGKLDFAELVDKYKSGGLDGKITMTGYYDTDRLQENYKKLCNAVRQGNCDIVYPDMLPEVESEYYNWYGLYYDENNEIKPQIIHVNKYMTNFYSANDTINEIYKWYNGNCVHIDA